MLLPRLVLVIIICQHGLNFNPALRGAKKCIYLYAIGDTASNFTPRWPLYNDMQHRKKRHCSQLSMTKKLCSVLYHYASHALTILHQINLFLNKVGISMVKKKLILSKIIAAISTDITEIFLQLNEISCIAFSWF